MKGTHFEKHNVCFYGSCCSFETVALLFLFFFIVHSNGYHPKEILKQKMVRVFIFAKA
jgi:hypothetical protein